MPSLSRDKDAGGHDISEEQKKANSELSNLDSDIEELAQDIESKQDKIRHTLMNSLIRTPQRKMMSSEDLNKYSFRKHGPMRPLFKRKSTCMDDDDSSSEIEAEDLPQMPSYLKVKSEHSECKTDEDAVIQDRERVEIDVLSRSSDASVEESKAAAEPSNESQEFKSCNDEIQNPCDKSMI